MKHTTRPQSIAWFQDHYRAGRLTLRPPFQRKPVWTDKQRSALIESALLNIPIPEVYVQVTHADDGTEAFGVIDGQQRLRTILQFVGLERDDDQDGVNNNNFVLAALPNSSKFKDTSFADVQGESRKEFYQYEICVRFIYSDDQKEIEDVFKRLNKFMMPLKAQELRNATYHGAFAKLAENLADDDYWAVNRIVSPAAIRRMSDIEMMSDLLIGLLHGPQGGAAKIIDSYYEQYEQYDDEFPDQTRIKRTFERTKAFLENLFGDVSATRWGNRADFYSLFVALGSLLEKGSIAKVQEKHVRDALISFADQVEPEIGGN
ncbi:MAG: DUF262 domain-containing protein [Thermomonas sp.]